MTLEELKEQISNFQSKVRAYRALLVESRDRTAPRIIKNGKEITERRSELNREYARLEKFIKKIGNNPTASDGVNPQKYWVYLNAFSTDILLRIGPSLDMVLQDLDYIIGKLEGLTGKEFDQLFNISPQNNLEGNFIAAKSIRNDGLIVSDTFNQIITDNYKGTGSIKSVNSKNKKRGFLQRFFIPIIIGVIITVIGLLIERFIF